MSLQLSALDIYPDAANVLAHFELQDIQQLNRLSEFILQEHYGLRLQQIELFKPGQLTCRVRTNGGRFFLKIYEKDCPRDLVQGQIRLMRTLLDLGIPCPEILINHDEKDYFICNGHEGFLMSCIDGDPLKADDPRQVEDAGRLLARMHDAGYQLHLNETDYLGRWHGCPRLVDDMYEIHLWIGDLLYWALNENDGKGQNLLEDTCQLILRACDRYSQYQYPRMLLHGRPKGSHFLQKEGLILGLVDYNWSGIAERVRDVVHGAVCLGETAKVFRMTDFATQKRFIAAYDSVMPLEKYELQSLPVLMIWSHLLALRALLVIDRQSAPNIGRTINLLLSNTSKWVNECR